MSSTHYAMYDLFFLKMGVPYVAKSVSSIVHILHHHLYHESPARYDVVHVLFDIYCGCPTVSSTIHYKFYYTIYHVCHTLYESQYRANMADTSPPGSTSDERSTCPVLPWLLAPHPALRAVTVHCGAVSGMVSANDTSRLTLGRTGVAALYVVQ